MTLLASTSITADGNRSRRRTKSYLRPTDLVLAALTPLFFIAILAGNWLQLVSLGGGLAMYGVAWITVLLACTYFFAFGGPPPSSGAAIPLALTMTTVAMLVVGTIRNGFAGQAIPVSISIIGIALMLAFGSSIARYERRTSRLLTAVEAGLVLQATLIVPKVALLGTNAVHISSRPFGLAAAVVFAWRLHRHNGPLATLFDPVSWLLVGCALLSQSRTALLAMALALVVSSMAEHQFRIRYVIRSTVVLVFLAGASFTLVQTSETARDRLFGEAEQSEEAGLTVSLSNRENIWPEVAKEILRDPITPNGAGSSAQFIQTISEGDHANPHNDYLRIAFDAGLVGIAALVGALALLSIVAGRRVEQQPRAVAAITICLTIGVAMAFTNVLTYLSVSWPAFLLAGAAAEIPLRSSSNSGGDPAETSLI